MDKVVWPAFSPFWVGVCCPNLVWGGAKTIVLGVLKCYTSQQNEFMTFNISIFLSVAYVLVCSETLRSFRPICADRIATFAQSWQQYLPQSGFLAQLWVQNFVHWHFPVFGKRCPVLWYGPRQKFDESLFSQLRNHWCIWKMNKWITQISKYATNTNKELILWLKNWKQTMN